MTVEAHHPTPGRPGGAPNPRPLSATEIARDRHFMHLGKLSEAKIIVQDVVDNAPAIGDSTRAKLGESVRLLAEVQDWMTHK